jgi:hypothetical protein
MLRTFLLLLALLPLRGVTAPDSPAAFEAAPDWPAAFLPRLKPAAPAGDILRILTVEERVGEPRTDELVRVPLFLHDDEPNDPAHWAVYAEADPARRQPLVFQVDDIRRDENGRLTRCHLYLSTTLAAWERRRFLLVRRATPATDAPAPVVTCNRSGDTVTLAGEDLAVTFLAAGPRAGAIVALAPRAGEVRLPDGWIAPSLTLVRQAADCSILRRTPLNYATPDAFEVRDLRWAAGPLFAKFTIRVGPRGLPDSAEFTYRVPRHGSHLVQTERVAADGAPQPEVVGADEHQLLAGRLRLGKAEGAPQVRSVPAGLRQLTRATHGHTLAALVAPDATLALLPVPYVQTGGGSIDVGDADHVAIAGAGTFRRNTDANSATLRAFWGEVRHVFSAATDDESLWHLARRHFQPLVAVVDEPSLGPEDCRAAMPEIAARFLEIKNWSRHWPQDAALFWLRRDRTKFDTLVARKPTLAEAEPAFHLPKWARAEPPLPRDPKDQGRIDPYHLSYGSSNLPLLYRLTANPKLPATARAIGLATRRTFGLVNSAGFPRVDCFATAFNMQIGPLGLALFGGRETGDDDLARWALDAFHSPSVTAIYGHGQRPYPGEVRRPEPTDLLYEAISDFHLRSVELATGEDLWLHPAALTRYFDCVDVTADLQHRALAGARSRSWHRANFFRGQAHDHRWENWSCAPYAGLFARAADRGRVGSTEAAYWLAEQGRHPQRWAELMWLVHADLLLENLDRLPSPHTAPALPADLQVRRVGGGNLVRWSAVPGAAGYRLYRAEVRGGSWAWLNSPYTKQPGTPITTTEFTDEDGRAGDNYLVTAVDAAGRESRWYADEPGPR